MNKLIALLAVALLSTSALAGDDKDKYDEETSASGVEQKFKSLDRDDDDQISRAEAQADDKEMLSERFASVDSDGDGYLTKDEYSARPSSESFE